MKEITVFASINLIQISSGGGMEGLFCRVPEKKRPDRPKYTYYTVLIYNPSLEDTCVLSWIDLIMDIKQLRLAKIDRILLFYIHLSKVKL